MWWGRRCRLPSLLAFLLLTACTRRPAPHVVLWAWERPEHLTYLDPLTTAVAYLARTISWRDGHVSSRPRYQPLDLPPATEVIAVTRLESFTPPDPDPDVIASEILQTSAPTIQIDFDARLSERAWYATLLHRLHDRLPANTYLTITALASWCLSDPWIRDLPIADAVPMLFRLGAGEPRSVRAFSLPICRTSLGISLDEVPAQRPRASRLFIFNPRPWTPESYRGAMRLARLWQ